MMLFVNTSAVSFNDDIRWMICLLDCTHQAMQPGE